MRNRIVELTGDVPRIELFARQTYEGWDAWGNEVQSDIAFDKRMEMMKLESDNWIVQNLQNALDTWNEKLAEIWQIITQSPENFKGGGIWDVIIQINGALMAIGLALLVLFFVIGVMKTCGSLQK